MPTDPIVVSAVVIRDDGDRVLTVRKRGTERFMLPGGKPEPGETPAETAVRETREELGLQLHLDGLRAIGSFRAQAANEPDRTVLASVFEHPAVVVDAAPAAEIEEMRWLDLSEPYPADLAPLLRTHVLPALAAGG